MGRPSRSLFDDLANAKERPPIQWKVQECFPRDQFETCTSTPRMYCGFTSVESVMLFHTIIRRARSSFEKGVREEPSFTLSQMRRHCR
jgi:hypothetical protein